MTGSAPARDGFAVVGLAGRFPGSPTAERFFDNLVAGRECLSRFSRDEMLAAGVEAALLDDPAYVPVGGALDGAGEFAAAFFGYTPREALLMDPQQRIFLECCWEALENAGWGEPPRATGVFAGTGVSGYLLNRLARRADVVEALVDIETTIATDKDFLATRVAYKLDLRGPSVVVQSACSSSLVAVHLACQALAGGDCEMALAGGVSIDVPQRAGYLYKPDGIYASDGHCRPFEARADGMVGGSGVGVVVLKSLRRARGDGDRILAIVRGSAVNNDGGAKVGYTAPGVDSQAAVIAAARRRAGVEAETIQLVEAHGTGTALGDPIEFAALTQAFDTERRGFCALGAVKANIGHLNAAAGVAGLIKAILAVDRGRIPPLLHFETPNPHLDFDASPFYANREAIDWPDAGHPRRAAVSSFGMGGTNAHVVIEADTEAGPLASGAPGARALLLSARSESELEAMRRRLGGYLAAADDADLADVSFTLERGRRRFPRRAALVTGDLPEAARRLERGEGLFSGTAGAAPAVAFLLPGQGAQYPGMGRALYDTDAGFRETLDRCAELLAVRLSLDPRELIFGDDADAAERLKQTAAAQAALFAVEYALARRWSSAGVEPIALLGHSIGEYTAACLAGVFSLEDGATLVAERGRLMQELPPGAMLAVALPEAEAAELAGDGLAVAAINEPGVTVVSGSFEAIAAIEERLRADDVVTRRLETSHAFHSPMMGPAAEGLRRTVAAIELSPPEIPFVSNLSGRLITPEQATDPGYWAEHLLRTVRFHEGLDSLIDAGADLLLEVGPGTTLGSLARRHPRSRELGGVISSLPHAKDPTGADRALLEAAARLWVGGVEVDWSGLAGAGGGRRTALPSYPFERQRFWLEPGEAGRPRAGPEARRDEERWTWIPSWQRLARPSGWPVADLETVVFTDMAETVERLREACGGRARWVAVTPSSDDAREGEDHFGIDPWDAEHYERLARELGTAGRLRVVHDWARHSEEGGRDRGFDSLLLAARALAPARPEIDWLIVTDGLHRVTGDERGAARQATVLGPCRVIPHEYPEHRCRILDLSTGGAERLDAEALAAIAGELAWVDDEVVIADRGGRRWRSTAAELRLGDGEPPIRQSAVCLVTGGTGGIGAALAEALVAEHGAAVALLSRRPLPPRETWKERLASAAPEAAVERTLEAIRRMEAAGGRVLPLVADVTDRVALDEAIATCRAELGPIDLVVHAAGVAGGGALELKSLDEAHRVMAAKVEGTTNLVEALEDEPPRRMVLCSSLAAELGGYGQIDYCAANAFQDALATAGDSPVPLQVIDWETWAEVGMAVDTEVPKELEAERARNLALGLSTSEGQRLFLRLLGCGEPRVLVSTRDIDDRRRPTPAEESAASATETPPRVDTAAERPEVSADYTAPRTPLEEELADIWRRLFGIDRIGVDDDFFELGGHSLLATQLLNRIRSNHPDAELSLASLFEHPTIAQVAEALEATPSEATPPGRTGRADLDALSELGAGERREFFRRYLERRGGLETGADRAALAWDLRHDLDLAVYPHELEGAEDLAQVAEALAAIVAGDPSPHAAGRPAPTAAATPPPTRTHSAERLVFLLSAPRSGSTLLRLMLAGHSGIFAPPELGLLSAASMGQWERLRHGLFARDGLTRSLMELRGHDEATARSEVGEMIASDLPIGEVFEILQRAARERVLVDKSPAYALDAAILERAETLFERPRYLLLTRHPLAVMESFVRHRMQVLLSAEPVAEPWDFAQRVWTDCTRHLLGLEERVEGRAHHVRFEDLVRRPESTLRDVAGFLGVDFEPALLEPYDPGRMIDGPGDPDIFQHDAIEPDLADAWRSVRPRRPLARETLELAARRGYEIETPAGEEPSRVGGLDERDLLERLDELSDDEVSTALGSLLAEDEPQG